MDMFAVICLLISSLALSSGNPVVETMYGTVEGTEVPIHTGQIIDSYMAIPFARPPVGDLRFEPPQQPDVWDDIFLAKQPGNACIQPLISTVQLTHFGYRRFDEDCLHLNIYVPQRSEAEVFPVFVFIHGGRFQGGANFIYPGYFLAARDIVYVSVNYRLGILGYASTSDDVVPGNMGMLDQVLALQYIQENIEAFGGDPNRVTIVGESAGGASVGLLLMSPLASGLFHNAILHSGNELSEWVLNVPEGNPRYYLEQVAEQFDCPTESSSEMIDCLREQGARELTNAEFNCTEGYSCAGFRPVIDGSFLPDYPSALRLRGEYNKVPEIIGLNEDDASIFVWSAYPQITNGLNRTDFDDIIYEELSVISPSWPNPDRLDDAYQAGRFYYAEYPGFYDPFKNRDMIIRAATDSTFGYSADYQAKSHSDDSPVYFYVYDYMYESSSFPDFFGTFHGVELIFLFGWPYLEMEENEAAYNHYEANTLSLNYTDNDVQVSDYIITMWTNFVKFRNPTPEPIGPDNGAQITWPALSRNNLTYAYLAREPRVDIDYRQKDYAFWTEYLNYIAYDEDFFSKSAPKDKRKELPPAGAKWFPFNGPSKNLIAMFLDYLTDDSDLQSEEYTF